MNTFRFRKFVQDDIGLSFLVAVMGAVIMAVISFNVQRNTVSEHKNRAELYFGFCEQCSYPGNADYTLYGFLQDSTPVDRLEFAEMIVNHSQNQWMLDIQPVVLDKLLSHDPQEIQPLIDGELELRPKHRIDQYFVWSWTFMFWQIASVLCLVVFWIGDSFRLQFFPYRKWWFYIYGAIAWPWSLGLLAIFTFSLLLKLIQKSMAYFRSRKIDRPYEDYCKELNGNMQKTQEQWSALFSVSSIRHIVIPDLKRKESLLKDQLSGLSSQLRAIQDDYYGTRDLATKLENRVELLDETDLKTLEARWGDEFTALLRNKHVKAVQINDSCLEIYTDTFSTAIGRFGPVRVRVNLNSHRFSVKGADKSTTVANTGAGNGFRDSGGFCFGNMDGLINDSIQSGRINEAFSLMCNSFEVS